MAAAAPALDVVIKSTDLAETSHLKSLLQGEEKPIFNFGTPLAPLWDKPIKQAPDGTSVHFSIDKDASWKTGSGVSFGLSGGLDCKLDIVAKGSLVSYQAAIESSDQANLPTGDYAGFVYIRLALKFTISGSVGGAGNVGAIGISGNAKGSSSTSFLFCHRVAESVKFSDALHETLNHLVFPSHPSCAIDLSPYDIAQVTFNGSFDLSVKLSYGFPSIAFSAPGVSSTVASVTNGKALLSLPSGKVDIGAYFSVDYTHADDFTVIVEKVDGTTAFFYLLRAHRDDVGVGVGVKAAVTINKNAQVQIDTGILHTAVSSVAGNTAAGMVAAQASTLEANLNGKLQDWITNQAKGGVALGAAWDRQTQTTMLYKYKVAATAPVVLEAAWFALCAGDVVSAVRRGVLVPQAGSGVQQELDRSFTISFNLFNFFSASEKEMYFNKSAVYITDDGGIRFMSDIGHESDVKVNKILEVWKLHFLATADSKTADAVSSGSVDLYLELSETKNAKEAGYIADSVGLIPPNAEVNQAQQAMAKFLADKPTGTLNMVCVLKPAAYSRLSCSEFVGDTPPTNQQQDMENWDVFQEATTQLAENPGIFRPMNYEDWHAFNLKCRQKEGGPGNRRDPGNPVPLSSAAGQAGADFWSGLHQNGTAAAILNEFCLASASFMNLCDELHVLAAKVSAADTPDKWNQLLRDLEGITESGTIGMHYAKPTVGALLRLSNPKSVTFDQASVKDSFTCTLTIT